MRNAWKLLFNRTLIRSSSTVSRIQSPSLQVNPRYSSLLNFTQNPKIRQFSSNPSIDGMKDHDPVHLAEIFSKSTKTELDSLTLDLDHQTVHSVLQNLEKNPHHARLFFDWALGREVKENRLLRSKSFNLMLENAGTKGEVEEFWELMKKMEERGYRISKEAFLKVSERFKIDGMEKDLKLLNELYYMNSPKIVAARFRKLLLTEGVEFEVIHDELQGSGIDLSSDLVVALLDQISTHPIKALMFFQWVEVNSSFKMDGRVLNAMARVLGREDCIKDFWDTLRKMRNFGFEMEKETYVKVVNVLYKRRMIPAAVELYEFAMGSSEKPPCEDFLFLLKKIVVSKDLDVSLLTKVVRIFTNAGNFVKGSAFDGVIKSLRSVQRLGECDKVLKAMEGGGFVADAVVYGRVVVGLCDAGKLDEALEYTYNLEKPGIILDLNTWSSLVVLNCHAGRLDRALSCFKKLVELKGGENVSCTFDMLVNELCQRKSAEYALVTLKEMVTKKNVQPWYRTYKFLVEKLLSRGHLKEASSLLEPMKSHGFPPFIDPFVGYVSKSGTANDAMVFLKAMSVNEFPSTAVFIRVLRALLMEGRHQVAHDLVSVSPGRVRNHEDVLELFYSMKPDEAATAAAL